MMDMAHYNYQARIFQERKLFLSNAMSISPNSFWSDLQSPFSVLGYHFPKADSSKLIAQKSMEITRMILQVFH